MNWHWIKSLFLAKPKASLSDIEPLRVHNLVKQLLKRLQVEWDVTESGEEEGAASYVFSFQKGNFRLVANSRHTFVRVIFPNFYEVGLSQLDNFRFACNDFNLRQSDFKVYYTLKDEEFAVSSHLEFNFRLAANDKRQAHELGTMLQHTFEMARWFAHIYQAISDSGHTDLEEHNALRAQERQISSELEIWHQHPQLTWRDNETHKHTIGQLFRTFYEDATPITFYGLKVLSSNWDKSLSEEGVATDDSEATLPATAPECTFSLNDSAEISRFVLLDALGAQETESDNCPSTPTTIQVLATVGELQRKTFVIQLDVEHRTATNDYVSVLFIEPTSPLSPVNSETSMAEMRSNLTHRFLMVRDGASNEQKEAEFRYQWEETQDAMRRGAVLSDEQRFMGMSAVPNVGYNLYWGRRYFSDKRYYDALQHLENAYRSLSPNFEKLKKTAREHFFEICYFIGFCYAELKLYDRAYFYLDIVYPQNSVRYTTEYVNVLVNTKDFRALSIIERLLKSIEQELSNAEGEETDNDGLQTFMRFLLRRKGYVLIDHRRLDEAEAVFQSLLDFPDCEKQAIDELMYIEHLRAKENNTKDS